MPIIAAAMGSMTVGIARSLKPRSNAVVNSTMPQPRATVYSHRLPIGGRSTAMARKPIESVSSSNVSQSRGRPTASMPVGMETETGKLIVPASVAA